MRAVLVAYEAYRGGGSSLPRQIVIVVVGVVGVVVAIIVVVTILA